MGIIFISFRILKPPHKPDPKIRRWLNTRLIKKEELEEQGKRN